MNRDKTLILVEAVTLYSTGLDHTGSMDDLAVQCTEGEWKFVCDALSRAYEIMAGATNSHEARLAALQASRDGLAADNAKLRAALKPFAEYATTLTNWDIDLVLVARWGGIQVTVGDFRKAATVQDDPTT